MNVQEYSQSIPKQIKEEQQQMNKQQQINVTENQKIENLMNQIGDDINHQHYDDVKTLLLNRARIFLTRGILGTYIYCEDEATRDFLLSL